MSKITISIALNLPENGRIAPLPIYILEIKSALNPTREGKYIFITRSAHSSSFREKLHYDKRASLESPEHNPQFQLSIPLILSPKLERNTPFQSQNRELRSL